MKKRTKRVQSIPYCGGKARLASRIVDLLPPHTVYVEPFVGGGSVLCAKGVSPVTNNDHYREVINDLDRALINLYRQLRSNPRLIDMLRLTPYSKEEFETAKSIEEVEGLESAWAEFVDRTMSYSHAKGYSFGRGICSENLPVTWRNKVDRIQELVDRLRNVAIECDDAISVIEYYDSPQTLFYCDPPYPNAYQSYQHKFSLSDYEHLCWVLDNIQGSFVLSCYKQGIEPEHWKRVDVAAYCSASGKGTTGQRDKSRKATQEELGNRKRTESLFIVDRSKNTREELIDHLWSPSQGFPYRDMKQEELKRQAKTDLLDDLFG